MQASPHFLSLPVTFHSALLSSLEYEQSEGKNFICCYLISISRTISRATVQSQEILLQNKMVRDNADVKKKGRRKCCECYSIKRRYPFRDMGMHALIEHSRMYTQIET